MVVVVVMHRVRARFRGARAASQVEELLAARAHAGRAHKVLPVLVIVKVVTRPAEEAASRLSRVLDPS